MEEEQMDPGLITVTLTPPGLGGFPGLHQACYRRKVYCHRKVSYHPKMAKCLKRVRKTGNGDGEIPGDFPLPEGFPGLDALGIPEEVEPPEPVEGGTHY